MPSHHPRTPGPGDPFTVGDWLIEPAIGQATRGSTVVRLRPQLVDLLEHLALHPNETVSKDDLLDAVWADKYIADAGVARCIAELRQLLGDDPRQPAFIQTVPKRGYRLVAPVGRVAGEPVAPSGMPSHLNPHVLTPSPRTESPGLRAGLERASSTPANSEGALDGHDERDAASGAATTFAVERASAGLAGDAACPPSLRRRTWWPWAASLGAVVLAAAAWLVPWRDWIAGQGVRSLERDVIVLAFEHPQGPSSLWEATRVALAVGLEQSCPARVMSDVQAGQLLAYMGRRSDEAVTTPVARELCQRAGAPAVVRAAVAALEQGFVVSLEAEACGSGNSIVRGQLFAASTSDLPRTAGRVAASVGQGLRGTLARATQGSRPLVLASTTSLAALRALSLGDAERERGHASEAVRLYERAVELDGQFATAYARLGSLQTIAATSIFPTSPTGRPASDDRRKADYLRRAFELRDRVSEPERFHIAALYYAWVARDVVKALELLQSWNQLYPGSAIPLFELARLRSAFLGNYEQAIGEGRQALQLSPGDVVTLIALCDASLGANRLDEARSVLEAASKSAPDLYGVHVWRYALAALAGDEHAVQGELRWASRDPAIAVEFARLEAQRAMAAGRTRDAARLWQTVRDWSAERGYQTSVAGAQANEALWRAWAGETEGVAEVARQAVAASDHPQVQMEGGVALALAGDLPGARGVVDRLRAAFPGENLLATRVFVPTVGAAIALSSGRPAEAVDRLRVAEPYELAKAYRLLPLALRCRANLAAGFPGEAVAACTKLVEHRAVHPTTIFYPLAHRDLAEAWRRLGDAGRADEAERRFRELWPR